MTTDQTKPPIRVRSDENTPHLPNDLAKAFLEGTINLTPTTTVPPLPYYALITPEKDTDHE